MNLEAALIQGLIWAIMWGCSVTFIEMKWPHIFLHDYPKELQEVVHLPPFTNKKIAYMFTTIAMIIIISFIFLSCVFTYKANEVNYLIILFHIFIVFMCWNLFDLIVMDWIIFCTLQPKFIVLPGSEGHRAYKDFKFHFIGFLKGCLIAAISSPIIAGICFVILRYLIW